MKVLSSVRGGRWAFFPSNVFGFQWADNWPTVGSLPSVRDFHSFKGFIAFDFDFDFAIVFFGFFSSFVFGFSGRTIGF